MRLLRRLFAGGAGIAGGIVLLDAMRWDESMPGLDDRWVGMVPLFFLVVAALAIHERRLGAQLIARAAWWANLTLGTFLAADSGGDGLYGVGLALGAGLALLVAGQDGIDEASARDAFAPMAYRTTFLVLMVLALAEVQTLGLIAAVLIHHPVDHDLVIGIAFAVATLADIVAFVGIYRLTLWGAALAAMTAIGVLGVVQLETQRAPRVFVSLLALLQLAASLPMLVSVITKRPLPSPGMRTRQRTSRLLVAGLIAAAIALGSWHTF